MRQVAEQYPLFPFLSIPLPLLTHETDTPQSIIVDPTRYPRPSDTSTVVREATPGIVVHRRVTRWPSLHLLCSISLRPLPPRHRFDPTLQPDPFSIASRSIEDGRRRHGQPSHTPTSGPMVVRLPPSLFDAHPNPKP